MLMNNGRSLISFFIWSASAEYEKGDLIAKGDCIYRCTAGNPTNKENFTVMGRDPETDKENFKVYPGEMISTADEYFEFAEKMKNNEDDSQLEDKFISMHALYDILQRLYFGVSTNGIVDNYILKTETGIDYLVNGIKDLDKANDPVNAILQEPALNNGVLKVSRDFFPGLFVTDPDTIESSKNYYSSDNVDNTVVILRQYTYDYTSSNGSTVRRRTQELIDPVYGDIFIRYSNGVSDEDGTYVFPIASAWKRVSIGNGAVKTTLTALHNSYQEMYDNYVKILSVEGSTFKTIYPLSTLIPDPNYYPLSNVWINDQSGTGDSNNLGGCLYTVVVSSQLRTGLYRNYNVTIEALEINNGPKSYYLSDSTYITATKTTDENVGILFSVTDNNDVLGSVITNIYYKKNNEQ